MRFCAAASLGGSGCVLAVESSDSRARSELLDLRTASAQLVCAPPRALYGAPMVSLGDNQVVRLGGRLADFKGETDCTLFDLRADCWSEHPRWPRLPQQTHDTSAALIACR